MPKVIWTPQPGVQVLALSCPVWEMGITGTRGVGKTDVLLMDYLQHVGQGWGPDWRGILFREEYKPLADVVQKTLKWFPKIFPNARFLSSAQDYKWIFPDGEELLLRTFKKISDYWNYHGHAYQWVGWEELTAWPDLKGYHMMKSTNRSARVGVPLKYRSTFNPYGPGHNAVKAYFIDPAPAGVPFVSSRSDASSIAEEFGIELPDVEARQTVCLHGHYAENLALMEAQPDYAVMIAASAANPEQAKAWLSDDWDIVAGGMFDDVWVAREGGRTVQRHILPAFKPPPSWTVTRSYDWGSSKPFSVGWWAHATGEAIRLPTGRIFAPPRGSLIRIAEWYGWDGKTPNVGLRMDDNEIGRGIVEREKQYGLWGRVEPGPADSMIFDADPGHTSPAAAMAKYGVRFHPADKSPGSRKRGWSVVRSMLAEANKERPEGPALYVTELCKQFIRTVPALPRSDKDPDDVHDLAEDHVGEEVRHACVAAQPSRITTRAVSV
jgi:hypothetical protein